MPADFEKQSYWRERFVNEDSFEWLVSSATFIATIEPYLERGQSPSCHAKHRKTRILQLGSGTSDLQNILRTKGYLNVTNVDFEPLALERGRRLEASVFGDVRLQYAVADVTQLQRDLRRPEAYDVVLDKSTADAVSCGGEEALMGMAKSVRDCLAEDGFWISLSYSASRFDIRGLPFEVEAISKIRTPKERSSDPDVFYWCYLLRPRACNPRFSVGQFVDTSTC
ncbi:hypothetical protein F5Y15DRAFT_382585 [Xylariaceae sp. FL0016]|nr:hypothetical protein F5Y15DRAFT_382585 [Xylariaceae sp. FL0016]